MKDLHILTPLSDQTPADLWQTQSFAKGTFIADLRGFPAYVFKVCSTQNYTDITAQFTEGKDYWQASQAWLLQFTKQTRLQDRLTVAGYGWWWSLNFHHFMPASTDLGNSFVWINLLEAISKQFLPKNIIIYGSHQPLIHLVKQIYQEAALQIREESKTPPQPWYRPPLNLLLIIARSLLSFIYFLYASIWRKDIYLFSTTNLLRRTTIAGKQHLLDVYQGDLAAALPRLGWRTGLIETYGWNASWSGLLARGFFFPTDLIFLLTQPRLFKLGFYKKITRKWNQTWLEIEPELKPHLTFRGYDISPFLWPLLKQAFTEVAPSLEIMTHLWRYVWRWWRPKLLYFLNHHYGRSPLSAIIAAKSLNIPTIEQQHGIVHKNHWGYMVPKHLAIQSQFPLCDKMVVWGEYVKRLLVENGSYQSEDVAVCGFPRFDLSLQNLPPRNETLAHLSMPEATAMNIVLYTSSTTVEGLMANILDSIGQVSEATDIYWLIKLHPGEKSRHRWEAAIRQCRLKNIKVLEDEVDFYALLLACDLHVSFASTTIIEAAVLGKLNLGLAVANLPDPVGYAEVNGVLPVTPDKLGVTAHRILSDPTHRHQLLQQQKQFAADWCLHDGQALERIVQVIEDTLARK